MKKTHLLLPILVILILAIVSTAQAQKQDSPQTAKINANLWSNPINKSTLHRESKSESSTEQVKVLASWISPLEARPADLGTPTVEKPKIGASTIIGKATAGAKITLFKKDLNTPEAETTTATPEGNFILTLKKPLENGDKITIKATLGADSKFSDTIEIKPSGELPVPEINQINAGDKHITGKTMPGATVEFWLSKASKLEKIADTKAQITGKFLLRLKEPLSGEDDAEIKVTWEGQEVKQSLAIVRTMDLTHANLIGLAPFGVVTSQQADRFSQSDPFGGFVVGYMAAARQHILCRVKGAERTCYYRVFNSSKFTPVKTDKDESKKAKPQGLVNGQTLAEEYEEFKRKGTLENGYSWEDKGLAFRPNLNIRIQGLFQADARKAVVPQADVPKGAVTTAAATPEKETTFLASKKTFDVNFQIWQEYRFLGSPVLHWGPYGSVGGSFGLNKNELKGESIAVDTPNGTAKTTDAITDNDAKMYYEAGMILNFYAPASNDSNLYIQAFIAAGNYQAYADLRPKSNTKWRGIGKLRVFPMGLNRDFFERGIAAPMFGIDLNAGKGLDHLKFFIGTAFNVTKLINKLKGEE
jgi:hypothetical protein